MQLITEKMLCPMSSSVLFISSCRSGKSYRMEELANRSEESFIYILNPFHSLEKLEAKEFFRAGKKEDMRKNAVFYSKENIDKAFTSYKEVILFAIANKFKIFIDETDLVEDILIILYENKYKNFLVTLQDLFYFQKRFFEFIENIYIGKINDKNILEQLFKIDSLNNFSGPEEYRHIQSREFLKVK